MLLQLCILFAFLGLGELIVWGSGIPVPSSIIGMILLFVALCLKWVKIENVEKAADVLTGNLGFFFIPAGIGVMKCFGLISSQWLPIVMVIVMSTALIMIATGGVFELAGGKLSIFYKKKISK